MAGRVTDIWVILSMCTKHAQNRCHLFVLSCLCPGHRVRGRGWWEWLLWYKVNWWHGNIFTLNGLSDSFEGDPKMYQPLSDEPNISNLFHKSWTFVKHQASWSKLLIILETNTFLYVISYNSRKQLREIELKVKSLCLYFVIKCVLFKNKYLDFFRDFLLLI